MRRITITFDDALVELVESDVAAGRSPSVSAWVASAIRAKASAIRAKAQARAELIADLDEFERRDPTPPQVIDNLARSLGVPRLILTKAFKRLRPRPCTKPWRTTGCPL